MKKTPFLIILLLLGAVCCMAQNSIAKLPPAKHAITVIAHRGDHTAVPENTLAAYKNAIQSGADYVEIDLRTTKDGKLILMHNATVDHMTNGTGNVHDLTFDEIRKLKVTDKARAGSESFQIPTFEEALKLCKGRINIYLDFKDADVEATYNEIKKAGMENHLIVYANSEAQYHQWKKLAPQIPIITSLPDEVKDTSSFQQFLNQFKVAVLDGSIGQYDETMLLTAKENGVAIWLDVQNKNEAPAHWDKALNEGISGLQTDHPAALVQYLKGKGLR